MKRFIPLFLAMIMVFSACAGENSSNSGSTPNNAQNEQQSISGTEDSSSTANLQPASSEPEASAGTNTEPPGQSTKILVAYFSATGTTKQIAEHAANAMGADLYEITPAQPYTSEDLNYNDKNSRSTKEMDDPSCRPQISGGVENMADYDIVFIGYPIWWGEAPRIVSTFVESYDFSGKTVVTFSTSGGSGHNDRSIKNLAGGANWITGTRIRSNALRSDVVNWINGLNLNITAE